MAQAVGTILITNYVFGGPDITTEFDTVVMGIPVPNAIFSEVSDSDPKAEAGVNSKITYRLDPDTIFFTDDTVATLVAKSNGTVSASS